jgi:hypothetical protein
VLMWKQLSLTVGLCFGIGLGLAPTLPIAHASKCAVPYLTLELEAIEGDVDPDAEQAFWSREASIDDFEDDPILDLSVTGSGPIELERR